jgi:aspyridone synthetase trans-acting enoyl reductase
MSIAETQRALKVQGPEEIVLATSCPIPQIKADEVLVRVVCVAVNPVDGKSADLSPSPGATLGCDFSGELVTIGSAVKQILSVGDRVCGCVFGNNPDAPDNGAFSEYLTVPGDLVFKIPPQMSFRAAATLGVGMSTVGMALYHALKLPLPQSQVREPFFVLVYGGGTATGTIAIQILRL